MDAASTEKPSYFASDGSLGGAHAVTSTTEPTRTARTSILIGAMYIPRPIGYDRRRSQSETALGPVRVRACSNSGLLGLNPPSW